MKKNNENPKGPKNMIKCFFCGKEITKRKSVAVFDGKRVCRTHSTNPYTSIKKIEPVEEVLSRDVY